MSTIKAKSLSIASVTLVFAAMLALMLAGCGLSQSSSAASSDSAASAEASAASAASEGAVASAGESEMSSLAMSIINNTDASKAEDLSKVPKYEDGDMPAVDTGAIEKGIEDQSKAPAGKTLITCGGIQTLIPSSWMYRGAGEYTFFESADGSVVGLMHSMDLPSQGEIPYYETLVSASPSALREVGYESVEIVNSGYLYTGDDEVCGSYAYCVANKGSETDALYTEVIQSKSYATQMMIYGSQDAFKSNINDIKEIIDNVDFSYDESV